MKTYISIIILAFSPVLSAASLFYTAVNLGNPNTDLSDTITLTDISNSGTVTGYSLHGANSSTKGIVWNNGSVTILNNLGGIFTNTSSRAYSVNNSGQVVGSYTSTSLPGVNRSFVLQNNIGADLLTTGIGPSNGSIAYSINDGGVIVGGGSVNLGGNFYLENGITISLPHLSNDTRAQANDINNNNVTVGKSYGSGTISAVMWQNGTISSLGLTGSYSESFAINDDGQIIGMSSNGGFLWKDGVTTYFPDYDMRDINNLGQIIAGNRIYDNGTFKDIEIVSDLDPTGGVFYPRVINDQGQIAGIGSNGNVFLLTPTTIPEPSQTMVLLISSIVFITRRKK